MRTALVISIACFLISLTSGFSEEQNASDKKENKVGVVSEKLLSIKSIGYEDIDFAISYSHFIEKYRGAMRVRLDDDELGVKYYIVQSIDDAYDLIGFMFLDDQLMSILFICQEEHVCRLGGTAILQAKSRKRFGVPAEEDGGNANWVFPTIDRNVVGVSHDKMWTICISRMSLMESLDSRKTQLVDLPIEERSTKNTEEAKPKEGWVFWCPTAEEKAEMELEAKAALRKERRKQSPARTVSRANQKSRSYSASSYSVAIIDCNKQDYYIAKVDRLLSKLDARFPESKSRIADKTLALKKYLARQGHELSMMEIMRGVEHSSTEASLLGINYIESCALYGAIIIANGSR